MKYSEARQQAVDYIKLVLFDVMLFSLLGVWVVDVSLAAACLVWSLGLMFAFPQVTTAVRMLLLMKGIRDRIREEEKKKGP